jgi:hypothetical protein
VAGRPHSAAHVEASDPDIIVRRLATSERTMTPAMASIRSHSNRARPISTTPISSDGASATALLADGAKRILDNKPQLKGRLNTWSSEKLVRPSWMTTTSPSTMA